MNASGTSSNFPDTSVTTARQVMEDIAEWWIRLLLQDFNVDRFQSCLESVLPHISPIPANSALAAQFRLLSLWEEVLLNTHFQGDFAMLRDKLLLLSTQFEKSPEYETCMQLLKVHELLGRLYTTLTSETLSPSSANKALQQGMQRFRQALSAIYLSKDIPDELSTFMGPESDKDISFVLDNLKSLVASNAEYSIFGFDTLRDRIQELLLDWVKTGFDTPTLVQLGYRTCKQSNRDDNVNELSRKTPPRHVAPIESPLPQGTTMAHVDDDTESVAQSSEEDRTLVLTQHSSSTNCHGADDTRNEEEIPDSEATELVPAQHNSTFNGSGLSFDDADDEAISLLKRRSPKILAPLSSRRSQLHSPAAKRRKIHGENESPNLGAPSFRVIIGQKNKKSRRRHEHNDLREVDRDEAMIAPRRTGSVPRVTIPSSNSNQENEEHRQLKMSTSFSARIRFGKHKFAAMRALKRKHSAPVRSTCKRRPFSGEENQAVLEGVQMFGSDWTKIKAHFHETLAARSIINIQDRARSLSKKGILDSVSLEYNDADEVVFVDV